MEESEVRSPESAPVVPVSIVNDTSGENHTGCNAVIEALLALCEAHGLNVIERLTRRQILDGTVPSARAKLVIVNGEGSLHHNTSQAAFFPKLLTRLDENSQPAVLINSVWDTAEFMRHRDNDRLDPTVDYWELMARWVRLVSMRESLSYKQLLANSLGPDPLITPDLSFWHLTNERVKRTDPAVQRAFAGYSDSLPPEALAKLKAAGEPLVFLPLRPARSIAHFIAHLGDCHTYHTARFHGACLALMAGVPEIVTYPANTHKIDALMADANPTGHETYCKNAPARIDSMMRQVAAIARKEAGL